METIIEIRKELHAHPGISGEEEYAHDLICRELSLLAPDGMERNVGGYGVVAYWSCGKSDAKTIAFRADIDALPTGHRCGHDGHTAIMIDVARRVSKRKSAGSLRYNVVLVFQPEEETGKGAKKIVKSGILEKYGVAAIFGMHNLPGYERGTIVVSHDIFAAASCGVHYMLHGRTTHASTPEMGINPGLAISEIISGVDKLSDMRTGSFKLCTLICCRLGEEAFGTSAGDGEIMYTLRSFTDSGMKELMEQVDKCVIESSNRYGLELSKRVREPFRATVNDARLSEKVEQIFRESGREVELIRKPFRWSEDFAEYQQRIPGVFFGVGSGKEQHELHHPSYVFPDVIIESAADCFEMIMNNIEI